MTKFFITILVSIIILCGESYGQLSARELSKPVTVTVRDLLDLRLQILAAQLTSGSYVSDIGRLGFPVSIEIDNDMKIRFNIDGSESRFDSTLTRDLQKEVIEESMTIVKIGIIELFRYNFPKIDFDPVKDLIGYWYSSQAPIPSAKWENDRFIWLE